MSQLNGDKSRFNRERKKKIEQRRRNRELRATLSKPAAGKKA
jgi:hypothetical protein